MTRRLVLTRRAERDLDAVEDYTCREWGKAQWLTYLEAIEAAFANLLEHPQIGFAALHLGPDIRALPVERHVIYSCLIK